MYGKRGLTEQEAAQYCGVPLARFKKAVEADLLPRPVEIMGVKRWDVVALDMKWDRLSDLHDPLTDSSLDDAINGFGAT